MIKKLTLLFILTLPLTTTVSQIKYQDQLAGITIGFGAKVSTPIFGANYEYQMPPAGIGLIGLGALIRYWTYTEKYQNNDKRDFTVFMAGGQLNYNFNELGSGKFVPFVGLVAGFRNVTEKYTSFSNSTIIAYDTDYKSGFLVWLQGGARYFFSKKIAGVVRLGLGSLDFSTIELGVDYKF